MCRGGRRFAPTKTWRKWHVKINLNEKRYAIASAVAATAVPSLVLARGHRIEQVNEIPLVIADTHFTELGKTREAVTLLKAVNAYRDVAKVSASRKLRAGRGKMRNRRHRQRLGPLIIHDSTDAGIVRSFRNIPGVETANVNSLNLLQLAPGGHLGRFVIWSEGAFRKLDYLYGKEAGVVSEAKSNYVLPWNVVGQADIARVINSDEVQTVLKAKGSKVTKRQRVLKKNPLRNRYLHHHESEKLILQASASAIESICQGVQESGENCWKEGKVGDEGRIPGDACSRLAFSNVILIYHHICLCDHKICGISDQEIKNDSRPNFSQFTMSNDPSLKTSLAWFNPKRAYYGVKSLLTSSKPADDEVLTDPDIMDKELENPPKPPVVSLV